MPSGVDRAVVGLGIVALAAPLTTFAGELDPVRLVGWGLVVTLVLGAAAVLAGWLGRRRLVLVPGLGFLAAAIVQIVQLGGELGAVEHGLLGGNASTFALWLGLGIGLAVLGATPDDPSTVA